MQLAKKFTAKPKKLNESESEVVADNASPN